jgi:hypothetical protein
MEERPMAQTGTCPICEWPVREHRRCPCCGWELKSDELILGDPGLPKRFQRTLNETRKRWQEAAEAYRAGRMGFGEEAIERLRQRLREQGFRLGSAFPDWARAHAPGPFGGTAFLGIQTSEDAEILIDGIRVGETRNGYLALRDLRAGTFRVEARSRYGRGAAQVTLHEGEAAQIRISLKPGSGYLRILSEIGPVQFRLTTEKRYGKEIWETAPARVAIPAGVRWIRIRRDEKDPGWLGRVEVLPEATTDVEIRGGLPQGAWFEKPEDLLQADPGILEELLGKEAASESLFLEWLESFPEIRDSIRGWARSERRDRNTLRYALGLWPEWRGQPLRSPEEVGRLLTAELPPEERREIFYWIAHYAPASLSPAIRDLLGNPRARQALDETGRSALNAFLERHWSDQFRPLAPILFREGFCVPNEIKHELKEIKESKKRVAFFSVTIFAGFLVFLWVVGALSLRPAWAIGLSLVFLFMPIIGILMTLDSNYVDSNSKKDLVLLSGYAIIFIVIAAFLATIGAQTSGLLITLARFFGGMMVMLPEVLFILIVYDDIKKIRGW